MSEKKDELPLPMEIVEDVSLPPTKKCRRPRSSKLGEDALNPLSDGKTHRHFLLTIFNLFDIKKYVMPPEFRYVSLGQEVCPETKREHIHAYVQCKQPLRYSQIKQLFGDNTLHVEASMGKPEDNDKYVKWVKGPHKHGEKPSYVCLKEEKDYAVYGTMTSQGQRTDLDTIKGEILAGKSLRDVAEDHFPTWCRYYKAFDRFFFDHFEHKEWRDVNVTVLYGRAGSGKTRLAYTTDPDLYRVPKPAANGVIWFDGYHGQKTILFDDFYGWISYIEMLHLLDGHPYQAQTKGGYIRAGWTNVVLTSNSPPEQWYPNLTTVQKEALMRRITTVTEVINDVVPQPRVPVRTECHITINGMINTICKAVVAEAKNVANAVQKHLVRFYPGKKTPRPIASPDCPNCPVYSSVPAPEHTDPG